MPAGLVIHQENLRRGSVVVYLRLAPQGVSISGDRAELAYDLNLRPLDPSWPREGFLRPDMDSRRVINAWTPDAQALPGQRIRYSLSNSQVRLEASSLLIPQGKAGDYREARYAKFDLGLDGKLTLRGLTNMTMDQL